MGWVLLAAMLFFSTLAFTVLEFDRDSGRQRRVTVLIHLSVSCASTHRPTERVSALLLK